MDTQQLSALLQIEHSVRRSETLAELLFVVTNETRNLVPYDQAVFLLGNDVESLKVTAVSDHPTVDRTSPFIAFIERIAGRESKLSTTNKTHPVDPTDWSQTDQKDLSEFSPRQMLWLPLMLPANNQQRVGVLWLARAQPWTEHEISLLNHLAGTFAHGIYAFAKQAIWNKFLRWVGSSKAPRYILILLIFLMFLPVRISAIAPAEVVAKDPTVIASPLNGAVKKIDVLPGQQVKSGDVLVRLDDTELLSTAEVAEQDLLRTKAELHTTQQGGFSDIKQNAKVSELMAQVAVKEAELNFAQKKLQKSVMTAPKAGVVILKDPKDWEGKPVVVGERILLLADPADIELKIMVPVKDAIALDEGEEVKLFLDTNPINAITAKIKYAAYEPERTPDNVMAYKLIASFVTAQKSNELRIGMRGTAKLYGESVSLFYYLFRRPITATRQWLGW